MSGKKQLSILSFALRGKPPKKPRLEDAGQRGWQYRSPKRQQTLTINNTSHNLK